MRYTVIVDDGLSEGNYRPLENVEDEIRDVLGHALYRVESVKEHYA